MFTPLFMAPQKGRLMSNVAIFGVQVTEYNVYKVQCIAHNNNGLICLGVDRLNKVKLLLLTLYSAISHYSKLVENYL